MAFGIDLNAIGDPDSPFPTAIRECLAAPIWCLSHPLHAIDFTSYGYQNSVVSAVHFLRDTGKKIIDERRKALTNEEEVPSDILSYILKSVNEDTDLDYEELLDYFVTFFIAGGYFLLLCTPHFSLSFSSSHSAESCWKSANLIGSIIVFYSLVVNDLVHAALEPWSFLTLGSKIHKVVGLVNCNPLQCLLKLLDNSPLFSMSATLHWLFAHRKVVWPIVTCKYMITCCNLTYMYM